MSLVNVLNCFTAFMMVNRLGLPHKNACLVAWGMSGKQTTNWDKSLKRFERSNCVDLVVTRSINRPNLNQCVVVLVLVVKSAI